MLNVPVVLVAATVTDTGAANTVEALSVKPTVAPPAGAPADRVTVQLVLALDDKAEAAQLKPVTAGSC